MERIETIIQPIEEEVEEVPNDQIELLQTQNQLLQQSK